MFAQLVTFSPDEEIENSENSWRFLEFDLTANLRIIMRIEKNYSLTLTTSFKLVKIGRVSPILNGYQRSYCKY